MNIQQSSSGNVSTITTANRMTVVNGVEYPWLDKMKGRSISQINGKVYIDGYELKEGEWKKTLKGLWHLLS